MVKVAVGKKALERDLFAAFAPTDLSCDQGEMPISLYLWATRKVPKALTSARVGEKVTTRSGNSTRVSIPRSVWVASKGTKPYKLLAFPQNTIGDTLNARPECQFVLIVETELNEQGEPAGCRITAFANP